MTMQEKLDANRGGDVDLIRAKHAAARTDRNRTRLSDTTAPTTTTTTTADAERVTPPSVGPKETLATPGLAVAEHPNGENKQIAPQSSEEEEEVLAVACPIDEEDEDDIEHGGKFAYAVEYDPDAKPPIYKNRRFRFYGVCAAMLLIVLVISLSVGLKSASEYRQASLDPPAQSPSAVMPTTDREIEILAVLDSAFGEPVFETSNSYAATSLQQALRWIANKDPQRLSPDNPRLVQRFLMAFFYYHTTNNGEDGHQWRSCNPSDDGDYCVFEEFARHPNDTIYYIPKPGRVRWLSSENECHWEGVMCAGGPDIVGLLLFGQNLTGTLPTELQELPYLQQLSLGYNQLSETIPPSYTKFRHLSTLMLNGNSLTGNIPDTFFEEDAVPNLGNLNIGENRLSGKLDTRIGRLTNLRGLHINQNNFNGELPTELRNLKFLTFFRFHGNEFSGSIPTQLAELSFLTELWAYDNTFSGNIPTQLALLTRLTDLRLGLNREITGSIPDQIYDMVQLESLSLMEMGLSGTLSTLVGRLTKLERLEVNANRLDGTLPTQLANLTRLRQGWFHFNQFTGPVPIEICENVEPETGLEFLQADCFPSDNPPNPCRCCSACCDRSTGVCLAADNE